MPKNSLNFKQRMPKLGLCSSKAFQIVFCGLNIISQYYSQRYCFSTLLIIFFFFLILLYFRVFHHFSVFRVFHNFSTFSRNALAVPPNIIKTMQLPDFDRGIEFGVSRGNLSKSAEEYPLYTSRVRLKYFGPFALQLKIFFCSLITSTVCKKRLRSVRNELGEIFFFCNDFIITSTQDN